MDLVIDRNEDLTIVIVTGVLEADRVVNEIERFYSSEPTINVLWDLSGSRFDEITQDDVQRIATTSRKLASRRERGKTALVFSADLGFGLGRMFGTLQEVEDSPVQHRSFRSLEEAMAWLNEPTQA